MPRQRRKRTNEGKRKAVRKLLEDPDWSRRSTEWIRKRIDVHESVVRRMRDEMYPERKEWPRLYVTKHGTPARMDPTGIQAARAEAARVAAETPAEVMALAREIHQHTLAHYRHV